MEKKKSTSSAKKTTKKVVSKKVATKETVQKEVVKEVSKKKNDHSLFKAVAITLLVVIVLTWIIPAGQLGDGQFELAEKVRTGFNEVFLGMFYGANYYLVQIMFLIVIGLFYGVISKTKGYQAMINSMAKMWKGKEKVFVLLNSLLIALMGSMFNHPFVAIFFIPMLYSVAKKLGMSKMSTALMTFGSLLVGLMGLTYSNYGVEYINGYMGTELTTGLQTRFGILAIGYLVLNIFNIMMIDKKANNEVVEEIYVTEDNNSKKGIGYFITFGIIFVVSILGFIAWESIFETTMFSDFHTWLTTDFVINDKPVLGYILGNVASFGTWDITNFIAVLLFITIVIVLSKIIIKDIRDGKFAKKFITNIIIIAGAVLISSIVNLFGVNIYPFTFAAIVLYLIVKFFINDIINEVVDNALDGIKKVTKPVILVTLAYTVFVLCYWSGMTTTIVNWINSLTEGFNPYLNAIGNIVTTTFHVDFGFTGFTLGSYYATKFADSVSKIFVIMTSMNGLVSFIAPTSIIMLVGLSLSNISYKEWFKFIWKFVVAMLIILFVLFTII